MRLVLVFFALLLVAVDSAQAYRSDDETRKIGSYRFVLYHFEWNGKEGKMMQIWKGRKKIFEKSAHQQFIFSMDKQMESFNLRPNDPIVVRDLTGDGIPDVIVEEWSGGAHCCYTFDIYSLSASKLKNIWHHDSGNGHLEVVFPKKGLPQLRVENDKDYIDNKCDLASMPVDVYQWRSGAFRLVKKKVSHKRVD